MYKFQNKDFLISSGFLLFLTIASLVFSLFLTQGHFTYALDDPYIHMSTVKHFVDHGIWSVDGETYASASSSPLWVIVLSPFYLLLGAKVFIYIPFFLNIVFQILSLRLVFKIIKNYTRQEFHYLFGITIVLFASFLALSFGGMEHSLQIFLVILFIDAFLSYSNNPNLLKAKINLLIIVPFVAFVRYEDLALVVIVALVVLFYFKNWKLSLGMVFSSFTFIVLFGLWCKIVLNLGFVPSSIMAKSVIGDTGGLMFFIKTAIKKFFSNFLQPHIIGLFILIKSFLLKNKQIFLLSTIFILTLFAHLAFASIGWLYRYEAYLMVFGMINILIYLYSVYDVNVKWAYILLLFFFLIYGKRIIGSLYSPIFGSKNIYEQQIQMADFLHQKCNTCSIGANDIGAITYFTNIHLLDLVGLGNYEVIKHKKNGTYTNEVINSLLRNKNVSLVIVYDTWFENTTLDNYTKIGEWKILNNIVCGGNTVSFYSRNDQIEENYLKLKDYSDNSLSKNVVVKLLDKTK